MRRLLAGSLGLTVLSLPSGCSDCDESVSCEQVIQYEGTTYGDGGSTELGGVQVGTGERTGCENVCGVETGDVVVYELDGFSTEQVIGLRGSDGGLLAAVSTDLSERDQLRIRRQLDRAD